MQQMFSILGAGHQGFFLPKQASSIAPDVDWMMWYINIISIFFTVLIFAMTAYFAWRYRASRSPVSEPPGHNNVLEVVWSVIPALLLLIMFAFGFKTYMNMSVEPKAGVTIKAVGSMWKWNFIYTDPESGKSFPYDKLILPEGVPVQFILQSNDVIHSLFIPTMRMKKDVVPGRYNRMWVLPTRVSEVNPLKFTDKSEEDAAWKQAYDVYCAEYCGTFHSEMLTKAVVLKQDEYEEALRKVSNPFGQGVSLTELGKELYTSSGCAACHSIDGSAGIGPTWKDLYGHQVKFVDGSTKVADDAYIHQSILEPAALVVEGYGPVMPSYQGQIDDQRINAIIEYMKSISSHTPAESAPAPAESTTAPVESTPAPH